MPKSTCLKKRHDSRKAGRRRNVVELAPPPKDLEQSDETLAIMAKLQITKDDRKRLEVKSQLEIILERIRQILGDAGMASNVPCTPSETELILSKLHAPPVFDIKKKKDDKAKQQSTMDLITKYVQNLTERRTLMTEIENWLATAGGIEGVESDAEMGAKYKMIEEMSEEIEGAIDFALQTTDRINEIGYKLLKEAGLVEDADDVEMAKERKLLASLKNGPSLLPSTVLTVANLEDLDNLGIAIVEVKAVLEQTIRLCKTHQAKTLCRKALKQYKNIITAVEKRLDELHRSERHVVSLKLENDRLNKSVARMKKELEQQDKALNDLDGNVTVLQGQVGQLEAENAELRRELDELKEQFDAKESWSASVVESSFDTFESMHTFEGQRSGTGQTPSHKASHRSAADTVRITESMMATATQALQAECESLRSQLNEKNEEVTTAENRIRALEEEISKQKEKAHVADAISEESNQYSMQMNQDISKTMQELQLQNEELEKKLARLQVELNSKTDLVDFQEKKIVSMKDDIGMIDILENDDPKTPVPNKIKRAVFRMKKDFELDMHRLKDHLEKEKHRHDVHMRKVDLTNKEHLGNIYKQSVHILRTINRFKETVANILERENLNVAAGDMRRIANLPIEEAPSDPRILLQQMAGNAVELLVNVEFKLSQALMNKRLEVKDNAIARTFAAKDLETQMEAAMRAKQASDTLTEQYKELKLKLATTEEALTQIHKIDDERFAGLSERYRRLMSQYVSLQKECERDQRVFRKELRDKGVALRRVLSKRDSMVHMVEKQQNVISSMTTLIKKQRESHKHDFKLSVADHKYNMQLLVKAFNENKISKSMFHMTQSLVKGSIELNEAKLRNLFKRYVTFRRFKDVKEHLGTQLDDSLIESKKKQHFKTMLSRMEGQLEETTQSWQHKRNVLEQHKRDVFDQMNTVFCDIISETGILLIPPSHNVKGSSRISLLSRSTFGTKKTGMPTDTTKSTSSGYSSLKLPPVGRAKSPLPELPQELKGSKMPLLGECGQMWRPLPPIPPPGPGPVSINLPRIVDLDVNRHLRAARKALLKLRYKPTYPLARVEGYDYHDDTVMTIHKAVQFDDSSSTRETMTTFDTSVLDSDSIPAGVDHTDGTRNITMQVQITHRRVQ